MPSDLLDIQISGISFYLVLNYNSSEVQVYNENGQFNRSRYVYRPTSIAKSKNYVFIVSDNYYGSQYVNLYDYKLTYYTCITFSSKVMSIDFDDATNRLYIALSNSYLYYYSLNTITGVSLSYIGYTNIGIVPKKIRVFSNGIYALVPNSIYYYDKNTYYSSYYYSFNCANEIMFESDCIGSIVYTCYQQASRSLTRTISNYTQFTNALHFPKNDTKSRMQRSYYYTTSRTTTVAKSTESTFPDLSIYLDSKRRLILFTNGFLMVYD